MTAVSVECPGADPFCYADDANAVASSRAQLDSVLGVTADFARLTNMKLNVPKCYSWATSARLRRELASLTADGETVKVVETARLLGAQMSFTRKSAGHCDVQKGTMRQ